VDVDQDCRNPNTRPKVALPYDLNRFGGKDQGSESNPAKHLTAEIAKEIREGRRETEKQRNRNAKETEDGRAAVQMCSGELCLLRDLSG